MLKISRPQQVIWLCLIFLVTTLPATIAYAQAWTELPQMKRERFESSAVQYNDDIYVFNGFGQSIRIEPTIEKFDAGTQTWSITGSTSVLLGNAVTHNGIVRNAADVWIIGGRKGSHPGAVSNQVWIYNLINRNWRSGPSLPVAGAAGGAALVNNKIHWFGGLDPAARCDVSNHFVYDLGQPSAGWQNITGTAPMPSARNHFATAVHNGWIYAIGGQYGHDGCPGKFTQDTNLVHAFNTQTNQWEQRASLPTAQSHIEPSTFVYNNAIYVVGGETQGNKMFRYDPSQNHWDTVLQLPELLLASVARVIDGKLIIASGGAPNAYSPTARTRSTSISPYLLAAEQNSETEEPEETGETSSELAEGESLIAIEAEYFDTNDYIATHSWNLTNLSDSSNNAAVITAPNSGTIKASDADSPKLGYLTYFNKPGTWYVWIRGWGDTNGNGEGGNDSVHSGLNGVLANSGDKIDYFPAGWNWSNRTRDNIRATINVPDTGVHAFNLWMREDGLAVDKIILTTDPAYVPSGFGLENPDNGSETITPALTAPTAGSTLTGSSQEFSWRGDNINEWWLYVGSSEGESDWYDSDNLGDSTSVTVYGLPTDGRDLFVRLFFKSANGEWLHSDSTVVAHTGAPEVTMVSPVPESAINKSQTFTWQGESVTDWWLYVGSQVGSNNIYNRNNLGTATSATVSDLPADGSNIYVRLYYKYSGTSWQYRDFEYTSQLDNTVNIELLAPTEGSVLSSSESFTWQGQGVENWWVYVGSSVGGRDIHNSGNLGTATSISVDALPADGSDVYVRLFHRSSGAQWQHTDYLFTAHDANAAITAKMQSPQNNTTLLENSHTFLWEGSEVDEWWIYAGLTAGGNEIYNSGNLGTATTATVENLPGDGRKVYVRLYHRQNNERWSYIDYEYLSFDERSEVNSVQLYSPEAGSTLTGAQQTFEWEGAGISEWWVYIGSGPGMKDISNSGNLGSATSHTVANLPTDGSAIYVRLFFRSDSGWEYIDSIHTAVVSSDIIALHYDVSPDLDDLHAIAAGANLSEKFGISPAVVIGAYGHVGLGATQSNDLKYLYDTATGSLGQGPEIGETRQTKARQVADAAYGTGNYIDTGNGWADAVNAQAQKFWTALDNGHSVSVADGGPMDFTADVLTQLQTAYGASLEQLKRVTVVQHSLGFNVSNTLQANRDIVSNLATYVTIDNGNVGGNATANLEDSSTNTTTSPFAQWARNGNSHSEAWTTALEDFNAKIDFSDTVEYLHILNVPLSDVFDITSFSNFFD